MVTVVPPKKIFKFKFLIELCIWAIITAFCCYAYMNNLQEQGVYFKTLLMMVVSSHAKTATLKTVLNYLKGNYTPSMLIRKEE